MGLAAGVSLALAGFGAITSAVGQVKAGNAAKAAGEAQQAAANSQADLADYNANVADLQAQDAIARGDQAVNKFRSGIRLMEGAQRAGFAGSNIDVGFGSAVDVQGDAAYLGELDVNTIKANAQREAWGFNIQAEDLRRRAEIERKTGVYDAAAGDQRQSAANIAAAGTLLTTGATLLSSRYGFGKTGGS